MELSWNVEIGDEVLDEEHRELLFILRDLQAALQAGNAHAMLPDAMRRLTAYAVPHFEHEQEMMVRYGYPDAAAHTREHKVMLERMRQWQNRPADDSLRTAVEVCTYLPSWIMKHMKCSDKALVDWLNDG